MKKKIYHDIISLFNIEKENGYFTNPLNESIYLNLGEKQPQIQKNGFEIYKIDGKYIKNDISVNFELQIKSMVNIFWSDIEHKVLYKNYNYMIIEDFFRDIMSSIKDNLSMIDRQLMLIYNHLDIMNASDEVSKKISTQSIIIKDDTRYLFSEYKK
jgi:Region found in RelA / SpoT proteins.